MYERERKREIENFAFFTMVFFRRFFECAAVKEVVCGAVDAGKSNVKRRSVSLRRETEIC